MIRTGIGSRHFSLLALTFGALGLQGCANLDAARYVYQDGEFGVVGIPQNTDHWPSFYHDQAAALMERHFPSGYEIVRAEEVVEGERTLTLNGKNSAEVGLGSGVPLISALTLGRTSSKNQADQVKIKECRILYRKVQHAEAPHATADLGFTPDPTPSPKLYLDPNAEARKAPAARADDAKSRLAKADPAAKGKGAEAEKADGAPAKADEAKAARAADATHAD